MPTQEQASVKNRKPAPRGRKASQPTGRTTRSLKSVAAAAPSAEVLLDLVERLGVADLVMTSVRSRIQDIDIDELIDEGTNYLRRNPEALVVSLGAATIAAATLVWINNRREWNGTERRSFYAQGEDVEEEVVIQSEKTRPRSTGREVTSAARARATT